MSNTPAAGSRTRRRATREVGPPVEDELGGVADRATGSETVERTESAGVAAPSDAPEQTAPVATEPEPVIASAPEPPVAATTSVVELTKAGAAPVTAVPAAGADADETPKAKSRNPFGSLDKLGVAAAIVALVSTLVLIGSGGVYFYHERRADALADRRTEYIQVAKQAVINLTTVKDGTAGEDIDRLLAVSSGSLKDEYTQNKDLYKAVFQQVKIQSTGVVLDAAIESDDADSARILVLAQQTISNAGLDKPQQKDYRFRVTVSRNGGSVTASKLEFVA